MKNQNLRTLLNIILIVVSVIGAVVLATPIGKKQNDVKRTAFIETAMSGEKSSEYWLDKAQQLLTDKLAQFAQRNENRAKNIILFLGDGMSVHTITATRRFLGNSAEQLSFERFPYAGLSKTYAVDMRVPDSASTATAYLSGVKANYGTIGVNAQVPRGHCYKANDTRTHTESLAKWAQDAGKWTGLVTTARVTHASPAGVYAHTADRNWENDAAVKAARCDAELNVDIARQLVQWPVGQKLRVVLGGGRSEFLDRSMNDDQRIPGRRKDGRNLIDEWLMNHKQQNASYVWSKQALNQVDLEQTEFLLGLFSASHCPFHGDLKRRNLEKLVPSLSEMTQQAIRLLSKNESGYFLFVEGAKIDLAHHRTEAQRSIEDTAEFSRAVEVAKNLTSSENTLIVVTSDHSHTMTINGYPHREDDIFGLAPKNADDGLPYTILSYANGPGYANTYSSKSGRRDLSKADLANPRFKYMATVPLYSETHGGEDVGVFAAGPYEHFFTGNYEQSTIPALMAYAANIGPFKMANLLKDIE